MRFGGLNQVLLGVAVLGAPVSAGAQQLRPFETASPLPQLHWTFDGPLGAITAAGIAVGLALPVSHEAVPPQGLDPSTVGWSLDRDIIGRPNTAADNASDIFLLATALAPPVLALATQPGVHGLANIARRPVVLYGESLLLTETVVRLLKPIASRPRPFTYLPLAERPQKSSYDISGDDAFVSMPSGHSALAFTAAAYVTTDHLLARPEAGWEEQVAVASVGALLAGFTGNLRIEAEQHFPTDALVGSLIGTASGAAIPLLHHYVLPDGRRAPGPHGHQWLEAAAGYVVGTGLGIGLASLAY